ncbi:MAG: molybdenum cofactor biosynthesis protein MoaE [Planctomycetes bacterium]|nr:molybdenum cofactor biosynthesis protein MoaE [Planctomycetota bacterium]
MTVRVLAFGSAAAALGWSTRAITLSAGATLSTLIDRLQDECPRLKQTRERLRYAVNEQYADPHTVLADDDEVAIIPPLSGGALSAARLVRERIDIAALVREVENVSVGAITTFVGLARYATNAAGQPLRAAEYSAYEPMALSEMRRLCEAATARHQLHKALLVHRLGRLKIGDIAFAVVVATPNRIAALEACRELVDGVCASVPIFKQEIWQDGETTWINGV